MDVGHPVMAIIPVTVVSATLALIAWQDWRYRRISNLAVLTLLLCALLRWSQFSGMELERVLEAHGFTVVLALLIVIPGSLKGIVGAGDTKLMLALALLWPTDQFLQVFSIGVLALLAVCLLLDTLKNQQGVELSSTNCTSNTFTMPLLHELTQRGLPLGSAIGLGTLLSTVT